MIKTLKNTTKEIYNWTKDKVIRFKKWLVILIFGAAVVAAPLIFIEPDNEVDLKEKSIKEENILECLIKTSDNIHSNIPKRDWTKEMYAKERKGNMKQGYVILCKDSPVEWGKMEKDPARFAVVKMEKSQFNPEWLEPEYDLEKPILGEDGLETGEYEIKTRRKYRLPLENFLSEEELDEVKAIEYNVFPDWGIEKTIDVKGKVELNDYERRPEDMKLHGSAGTFNIRTSGGDYTTLSAWEAGEQADLTGTGACIAEITEGFQDTTSVTINGWTTSATNYIKIYTTAEARHDGKWNEERYRLSMGSLAANALQIFENHVRTEGLQVSIGRQYYYCICVKNQDAAAEIWISDSIIKYTGTETEAVYGIRFNGVDITAKVWNNIIYDFSNTGGYGLNQWGGTLYSYNNTVQNSYYGYYYGGVGTFIAKNNIAQDCTDGFLGTFHADSDYNISDISGDAPNTGGSGNNNTASPWYSGATAITNIFVDPNGDDFHLKAGSIFRNIGETLNPDPDGYLSFSDDIDGDTRPAGTSWDIGADEYVSAAERRMFLIE